MKSILAIKHIGQVLGSLKLTVWLLVFAMLLVFFGTLDQVRIGIRGAQQIYFESIIAFWRYPETWPMGSLLKYFVLPLPGGYVVGPLLAANLVFSHIRHFRPRWGIAGISLIHAGVLLLLIGQLVTNIFQREHYMWLDEGASANFVRSFRNDELYVLHYKENGRTGLHSFSFESLREGSELSLTGSPLRLRVREVFENAEIRSGNGMPLAESAATRGLAQQFNLQVREIPSFRSDDQRDVRTAVVEVAAGDEVLGTWLVSNVFEDRFEEQVFAYGGEQFAIGLRYEKTYLPFTVSLLEFTHDRYPGTNIPKNFSSQVRVEHADTDEHFETRIFMNHPLRFEGLTFYQASFAKQDTASMFHVVRNPGRHLPYISCVMVSLGLLYQFAWGGLKAIRRKRT
jgi:hypothetical protein